MCYFHIRSWDTSEIVYYLEILNYDDIFGCEISERHIVGIKMRRI